MHPSKDISKANQKKASKKSKVFGVIFALLLCISIGLALYPTVSKKINTAFANSAVDNYEKNVDTMPLSEINKMFQEAEQYNAELADMVKKDDEPDFDPKVQYYDILDFNEDGIMGSVEIPSIDVRLPIYHGTDKEFLDEGAGHLLGTSFPIGGESTHAVISAHTAFPGKKFFDDLTQVKEGDTIYVTVLNRKLEYKVTNIQVVLPSENQSLSIVKGKDLVTLVTCTPYSINTHRLLVTGERVPVSTSGSLSDSQDNVNQSTVDNIPTNSKQSMVSVYVYIVVGTFVSLTALVLLIIIMLRKNKNREQEEKGK